MKELHKSLVDASRDFITLVSRKFIYDFANESYCRVMGIANDAVVGRSLEEIWGASMFNSAIKPSLEACFTGRDVHVIHRLKLGNDCRDVQSSYYPFRQNGEVTHAMVFSHDVSEVRHLESRLMDYEFKDPTTGLLNRKSFDIVLEKEMERAVREPQEGIRAVLLINLRDFSQINARYGYGIGDILLESTAQRIKEALRTSDYVFRYEGKELAVILTTIKRAADIAVVADAIRDRATFPYNHHGAVINIGCNIGISIFPDDTKDREDLVRFAASAMDEAKDRNEPYIIFNRALHHSSLRKAKLRSEMRHALVDRQFEAYYQPIVEVDGRVAGAEALIRWKHPTLGFVPPDEFIPLAEEAGYTIMIGRWMLFRVCRFIKRWSTQLAGRHVSVNLSAKEFGGAGLVEFVHTVIQAENIDPASLKLEITETESMIDIEDAIDKIQRLKKLGIEVYVDDFGSGYSSLAYLKRLPAGVVKIDRVFVDSLVNDEEDQAFVAGMMSMISGKKMRVLVEGVSSPEQQRILRELGADFMQGFWFGRPMPEAEFVRLLGPAIRLPLLASS